MVTFHDNLVTISKYNLDSDFHSFNPGIKPVGPRLLVYPIPIEERTEGGIILPESSRDREALRQIKAIIIDIGPEAWQDSKEAWAVYGNKVLISKYAGYLFKGLDDRDYRIINDVDVTAIIEEVV